MTSPAHPPQDQDVPLVRFGGVVLCGGRSARMGQPKLWLPFGPETMLQRVARRLSAAVAPVVVVAAVGQDVPALAPEIEILRDEFDDRGPLAGMAVGLRRLSERGIAAAYVTSCDAPGLEPAFVRQLCALLGEAEMAIPRQTAFGHPLSAVYRTYLWQRCAHLLAEDRRRVIFLQEGARVAEIDVEKLRPVDPELNSLRNLNTPDAYNGALRDAGY